MQTAGIPGLLKQSIVKTEQCADDNQNAEEKGNKETKSDKDFTSVYPAKYLTFSKEYLNFINQLQICPPGYYSKTFQPPRA